MPRKPKNNKWTDAQWEAIFEEYHLAIIEADKATKRKEKLNTDIKAQMLKEKLTRKESSKHISTLSEYDTPRIDTTKLKEEKPDIAAKYTVYNHITRLNFK